MMSEIEEIKKRMEEVYEIRCAIGAEYMEYVHKLVDVADDPEQYAYYEKKLEDLEESTNVNKDLYRGLVDRLRELENENNTKS